MSLRTLTLEPEGVELPAIDWEDASLVTTDEGRQRLMASLTRLSEESGGDYEAIIAHQGAVQPLLVGNARANVVYSESYAQQRFNGEGELRGYELMRNLSGQQSDSEGVFSLVSQLSPQGSDVLEDLAMSSGDNPEEYVLVVQRRLGDRIEVFRRLYRVAGVVQ